MRFAQRVRCVGSATGDRLVDLRHSRPARQFGAKQSKLSR